MGSSFHIARNSFFQIFILLVLAPIIWGCSKHSSKPKNITYELNINDKMVYAEVAFTQKDRAMGLMFRDKLDKGQGMLFIYPHEQNLSFWMKNTKIPLSIAFINSNEVITQIESMAPYSLLSHTSKNKVRFALEMEEGWFIKNGIKAGSKVSLSPEIRNLKTK
jgi:uncharacterized membrane protein (UPF0127 family)